MKHRPLPIVVISALYLLEPFGSVLMSARVHAMPVFGRQGLLNHLLWSDWLVLVLFPVVGVCLFFVKRWSWYVFVGFSALLVGYNLSVQLYFNPTYQWWLIGALIAVTGGVTAVFFLRRVATPFFNPRLRWWEIAPRYRVPLPVRVVPPDGDAIQARIEDISRSGCLVRSDRRLAGGRLVWITIHHGDRRIDGLGRTVREHRGAAPGYAHGIVFRALPADSRRRLARLLRALKASGAADRGAPVPPGRVPPDTGNGSLRPWIRMR